MGLFSFFRRNNTDAEIQQAPINLDPENPCYTNARSPYATSLQEYVNKNRISPMFLSTFFAAVNLFTNSIAMMKWKFIDKEGNELPDNHYLYHLFDEAKISRFNLMKNVVQDMILYGNGFIYIERDDDTGRPKTLHYSPASQTSIYYNPMTHNTLYANYTYNELWDDGTNYLHFYLNTDNGFIGVGCLRYAYNVLDIASTIQQATESYYSTTGQTFGIVTPNGALPDVLGNKQKQIRDLEASWNQARNKPNKGTLFFPADLKFIPLNSSASDSALIESREYNAVEVGRFVQNISPILLGDLRHNVYGTLAESQEEFIIHSLSPTTSMIEDQFNKKLVMPSKWGKIFVDLDEYSILNTDHEKQANYLSTLTSNGIMSRNEARKILSLPPVDGGDELVIPFSDVNQNTLGNENIEEESNEQE